MFFILSLFMLMAAGTASAFAFAKAAKRRAALGESTGDKAKQARQRLEAPRQEERTWNTLSVGDVIVDGHEDWLLQGRAIFDEEGELFSLFSITDGVESRLLCVADIQHHSGAVQGYLLRVADDIPDFGSLTDMVSHQALPHRLSRRGAAQVKIQGVAPKGARAGVQEFAFYSAPGDQVVLILEQADGRVAFAGRAKAVESLMLMPGS